MFLVQTVYLLAVGAVLQEVSGYVADVCNSRTKLIYGLKAAYKIPIEDAPYMAALQRIGYPGGEPTFFCGATIIDERFLLTAAHCFKLEMFKSDENDPTFASIGSERYRNTRNNTIIEIEKVLCHEGFDEHTAKNDICLLKLKKPVPFAKKIAKIQLPDKNFDVKTKTAVNVTGWGVTEDGLPVDLLTTTIPIVSHKCCHHANNHIDDTMICAGVKGRGPCYGDSGGPLLFDNVQIGVVSRSVKDIKCGNGMEMFTRVNRFLDWIHTTIANNL